LIKQQFQKKNEKTPSEIKVSQDQSRKPKKNKIVQQLTKAGIDNCNSEENSTTTVLLIKAKLL